MTWHTPVVWKEEKILEKLKNKVVKEKAENNTKSHLPFHLSKQKRGNIETIKVYIKTDSLEVPTRDNIRWEEIVLWMKRMNLVQINSYEKLSLRVIYEVVFRKNYILFIG